MTSFQTVYSRLQLTEFIKVPQVDMSKASSFLQPYLWIRRKPSAAHYIYLDLFDISRHASLRSFSQYSRLRQEKSPAIDAFPRIREDSSWRSSDHVRQRCSQLDNGESHDNEEVIVQGIPPFIIRILYSPLPG